MDPRRRRTGGRRAPWPLQSHVDRHATTAGEFRDVGGDAIEVLSSSHTPKQYAEYAAYTRVFGLKGSCGSDYHGPGESWLDLGDLPPLPTGVTPVWANW
jgi:predicted metal-dependent phosphoesterase TrpH